MPKRGAAPARCSLVTSLVSWEQAQSQAKHTPEKQDAPTKLASHCRRNPQAHSKNSVERHLPSLFAARKIHPNSNRNSTSLASRCLSGQYRTQIVCQKHKHTRTHDPRTHAPTHAPTHPRTHAPTHLRTHAPTHPPTHPRTHAPTYPPTHPPTHPRTHAPTHPHPRTRTHAPTHPSTHTPTHPRKAPTPGAPTHSHPPTPTRHTQAPTPTHHPQPHPHTRTHTNTHTIPHTHTPTHPHPHRTHTRTLMDSAKRKTKKGRGLRHVAKCLLWCQANSCGNANSDLGTGAANLAGTGAPAFFAGTFSPPHHLVFVGQDR